MKKLSVERKEEEKERVLKRENIREKKHRFIN